MFLFQSPLISVLFHFLSKSTQQIIGKRENRNHNSPESGQVEIEEYDISEATCSKEDENEELGEKVTKASIFRRLIYNLSQDEKNAYQKTGSQGFDFFSVNLETPIETSHEPKKSSGKSYIGPENIPFESRAITNIRSSMDTIEIATGNKNPELEIIQYSSRNEFDTSESLENYSRDLMPSSKQKKGNISDTPIVIEPLSHMKGTLDMMSSPIIHNEYKNHNLKQMNPPIGRCVFRKCIEGELEGKEKINQCANTFPENSLSHLNHSSNLTPQAAIFLENAPETSHYCLDLIKPPILDMTSTKHQKIDSLNHSHTRNEEFLTGRKKNSYLEGTASLTERMSDSEVGFSAHENLILTIEVLKELQMKNKDYSLVLLEFIEEKDLDNGTNMFLRNLEYLNEYPENIPLVEGDTTFFLLGIYLNDPQYNENLCRSSIIMPIFYGNHPQYNHRCSRVDSEMIIKCKGYFILNPVLNFTYFPHESLQKEKRLRVELIFPQEKDSTFFLKNPFIIYHFGQKLKVISTAVEKDKPSFNICRSPETYESDLCLKRTKLVPESEEMMNIETILSKKRSKYNNTEKKPGIEDSISIEVDKDNNELKIDGNSNNDNLEKEKDCLLVKNNSNHETNIIDGHPVFNDLTSMIEINPGTQKASSEQPNFSLTMEELELLQQEFKTESLVQLNIDVIVDINGRKMNFLNTVNFLDCHPQEFPRPIKKNMFILFSLYTKGSKIENTFGRTVLIMPMKYRGYIQYNLSSELESEMVIRNEGYFSLKPAIHFIKYSLLLLNGENRYQCNFTFPEKEEYMGFLKEHFMVTHAGQKFKVALTEIKFQKLWFGVCNSLEDDQLDLWLKNSSLVLESKIMIEYEKNLLANRKTFTKSSKSDSIPASLKEKGECHPKSANSDASHSEAVEGNAFEGKNTDNETENVDISGPFDSNIAKDPILVSEYSAKSNFSLTIRLLKSLNFKNLELRLTKLSFQDKSKIFESKKYLLQEFNFLNGSYHRISVAKDTFFIYGLFLRSPKSLNNLGETILLIPINFRKYIQYDPSSHLNSKLISKYGNYLILNTLLECPSSKQKTSGGEIIVYGVNFIVPWEEKGNISLKDSFVAFHGGQILIVQKKNTIKNELRFTVYKAPDEEELDSILRESKFIYKSKTNNN